MKQMKAITAVIGYVRRTKILWFEYSLVQFFSSRDLPFLQGVRTQNPAQKSTIFLRLTQPERNDHVWKRL